MLTHQRFHVKILQPTVGTWGKWKEFPLKAHCLLLPDCCVVGHLSWSGKIREADRSNREERVGVSDCRWWYHTWEIPKPPENWEHLKHSQQNGRAYKTNVWKSEAFPTKNKDAEEEIRGTTPFTVTSKPNQAAPLPPKQCRSVDEVFCCWAQWLKCSLPWQKREQTPTSCPWTTTCSLCPSLSPQTRYRCVHNSNIPTPRWEVETGDFGWSSQASLGFSVPRKQEGLCFNKVEWKNQILESCLLTSTSRPWQACASTHT